MNYFEKLKNRSVFLWRALFEAKKTQKQLPPVYIDRAPGRQMLPGAQEDAAKAASQDEKVQTVPEKTPDRGRQVHPAKRAAQKPEQGAQAAQPQERVLRGSEETEAALHRAARSQERAAVQESVQQNWENRTAQRLFERVQESARSVGYAKRGAASVQPVDGVQQTMELPAPEEWSAYFEKDARRYDGACELM